MVAWFKAELRSYYHDEPRMIYLQKKLKKLESRFEAHSPNLTDVRSGTVSRDERLSEYVTEKDSIEKELSVIIQKRKVVESIISRIDDEFITPIRMIYSGKQNISYYAYKAHRSVRGYKHHINLAILRALKDN
jgi:hypothetical protein